MSRSHLAGVALAALAFLPAAHADDAAPLKFGWPVPSTATVTEKLFRRGIVVTTRFTASIAHVESGDDLRVHLGDFAVVDFAGKSPDDPAVAQQVSATNRMSKVMPDLLLGPDGRVKDVVGIDEAVKALFDEIAKNGTDAEKAAAGPQRAQLETPEAKALMKREAMKWWEAWVGEWVGLSIADGGSTEGRHLVRDLDGTERDAPSVIRRAASTEGPGLVQLTREAVLEGDDTKASLDAWIKAMTQQTGQVPPEGHFTGLVLTSRAMAVTDPVTMRPRRSLREDACVVHRKNREDLVAAVDRHEYSFEWPADAPKAPNSPK